MEEPILFIYTMENKISKYHFALSKIMYHKDLYNQNKLVKVISIALTSLFFVLSL